MFGRQRGINTLFTTTLFWFLTTQIALAADITLAVANSTCDAIGEISAQYMKEKADNLDYICKSSGRLAKGLRGGAIEADIYISANKHWMDYMVEGKMVDASQVLSPWRNKLVVASRRGQKLKLTSWEELADDKVKTILIGDPGTAPFGRYAKQSLQSTGLWQKVRHKIETRKHITLLAKTLEDSQEGTVGILFATNLTPKLETIHTVKAEWHEPIRYFMAPLADAVPSPEVMALMDYLNGKTAQAIFRDKGFGINMP